MSADVDRKVLLKKASELGYAAEHGNVEQGVRMRCTVHVECPSKLRLSQREDLESGEIDVRSPTTVYANGAQFC